MRPSPFASMSCTPLSASPTPARRCASRAAGQTDRRPGCASSAPCRSSPGCQADRCRRGRLAPGLDAPGKWRASLGLAAEGSVVPLARIGIVELKRQPFGEGYHRSGGNIKVCTAWAHGIDNEFVRWGNAVWRIEMLPFIDFRADRVHTRVAAIARPDTYPPSSRAPRRPQSP